MPAPQGSLHNGGASESLIRSLPLEVYKSHHAPVSADLDESSAGLEMGLLKNRHSPENMKNGRSDGIDSPGSAEEMQQNGNSIEDNEDDREQCAICFDSYCDKDQLRVLPCMHRFHMECVDAWLVKNKSCPLCKHEIDKPCENQSKAFMAARGTKFSAKGDKSVEMDVMAGGAGLGSEHKDGGDSLGLGAAAVADDGVATSPRQSRTTVAPSRQEARTFNSRNGSNAWSSSRHGVSVPSEADTQTYSNSREMPANATE